MRLIAAAVLLTSLAASAHGSIEVRYRAAATPAHEELRRREMNREFLESFAALFPRLLRLPRNIALELRECDELAYWDPAARTITVCYGYYDFVESLVGRKKLNTVVAFTVYHELGHALAAELDLPILGRGEDAADHFATAFTLSDPDAPGAVIIVDAAWFFLELKKRRTPTFWDEHTTQGQRFYDLLCQLKGAQPAAYDKYVEAGVLPESRARRCAEEFRLSRDSWNRLLEPHSRVIGGRTF